jgi:hypothetical protein
MSARNPVGSRQKGQNRESAGICRLQAEQVAELTGPSVAGAGYWTLNSTSRSLSVRIP